MSPIKLFILLGSSSNIAENVSLAASKSPSVSICSADLTALSMPLSTSPPLAATTRSTKALISEAETAPWKPSTG